LIEERALRRRKAELCTFLRRGEVLAYEAQRATNAKAFFDAQAEEKRLAGFMAATPTAVSHGFESIPSS
jgi:hypothetical protein